MRTKADWLFIIEDQQRSVSFKTIEQKICGLRCFIRYLVQTGRIELDFSSKIILPKISKSAPIPST